MSPQDRFLTVGGTPVPIEKDESDLRKDANDLRSKFARAIQCPGIPSGASALHFIPTREDFVDFIRELCPWIAILDLALSQIVREIADTYGPNRDKILEWDTKLGPAGKSLLYHILVTKANMSPGLQKFFAASIGDDPCGGNGLAMLQVLCAATLQFTLHTVDTYIQNFINVASCSSAPDLHGSLLAHEKRLLVLKQMNAIGDGVMCTYLEIGILKRLCAKVEPAMRIITEMEMAEGTELSLSRLKEVLTAYAEKTFRDWQADKSVKVNAATITAPITAPTIGKAVAAAKALAAATAPITPAAAAANITPKGNCSAWMFVGNCKHHLAGTCMWDHLPAHMGVFNNHCYTQNSLNVSVPVCWNFARKGFCHHQTAGTCNREHIDIPICRVPPLFNRFYAPFFIFRF